MEKLRCRKKTFDAGLLVSNLIETFGNWIEQKAIQIKFHHPTNPLMGSSDPELFEKMVVNLLSNALKFTPIGGTITLSLWTENGHLHFEIVDSGQGIVEEDLKTRFLSVFYKSGNRSESNTHGSGIGLALVKEFAEWLGGTVCAENDAQGGAKFRLNLPFKVNVKAGIWESGRTVTESREEEQLGNSTLDKEEWPLVLVVDDHQEIDSLLSDL